MDCLTPGCKRKVESRGRCRVCHKQALDEGTVVRLRTPNTPTCTTPNCGRPTMARNMCSKCYSRDYWPKNVRFRSKEPCSFQQCSGRIFSQKDALCGGHYTQLLAGKPLTPLKQQGPCSAWGCDESFTISRNSSGYCSRHNRWRSVFSLTPEQMTLYFGGPVSCQNALCGETENLHLDHDHACCPGSKSCGGCVRGWLCRRCNTVLGLVGDSPETLQGLVSYLDAQTPRSESI